MKKSFTLIVLSLILNCKAKSQSNGGMEKNYYLNDNASFLLVPSLYYQSNNNWYFEGRYNFEAQNAGSFYVGKVFEKGSNISYSINPVAGLIVGSFNGFSLGFNGDISFKNIGFSTQSQRTFSINDKESNFYYSWSDLEIDLNKNLAVGCAVQHTRLFDKRDFIDKGLFIKLKGSRWSLPLYAFMQPDKSRYYMVGLNYEWPHKNNFLK